MWAVSAPYLEALQSSHRTFLTTATHRDPATGTLTPLPIKGGSIQVDGKSNNRRTLNMTVPSTSALETALAAPGGEITVVSTQRFINHGLEAVPLGVFVVDDDQIEYTPQGAISLTCPDRWLHVQRNRFLLDNASVPGNSAATEISRLLAGAFPSSVNPFPGFSILDPTGATDTVPSTVWDDGSREGAIQKIAKAHNRQVFFDAQGKAVQRPAPALEAGSTPVWRVVSGNPGTFVSGTRTRSRSTVRNAVKVSSSSSDAPFPPVVLLYSDPANPLSTAGALGVVPIFYASPYLNTSAQALDVAKSILAANLSDQRQLSLTSIVNPALDADDVIAVVLPRIDRYTSRPFELAIIESVTIPLTVTEAQSITTSATRLSADDFTEV